MVGDYLIESRCKRGHTGTATFQRYSREHVEEVARTLSDRCCWPDGSDDMCGARVAHVITSLSVPAPSSRNPTGPVKIPTKPSMAAVDPQASRPAISVVIVDDSRGEESTQPPPPSTRDGEF